jgi:hypothetical protein
MPTTLNANSREVQAAIKNTLDSALEACYVDAAEFRKLIVSSRRMERADRLAPRMRGLRDLDTGELFLTDERWLLDCAN